MVEDVDGELRAGALPAAWDKGLAAALESLWADLPRLSVWNPLDGWRGGEAPPGNPFPSAYLLAFLLLARLPEDAWVRPETVGSWLFEQHPYWTSESLRPSRQQPWLETFLLGVAYQLRLVQAVRGEDDGVARAAVAGRPLAAGTGRGAEPGRPFTRRRCWCSRTWRSSPIGRD